MIFFRVFKDADDPVGTLYNRRFQAVTSTQTGPSDLVITVPPNLFGKISVNDPRNIILRVHADKSNQDAGQGRYYDENFTSIDFSGPVKFPPGGTVILTITPDEFDAMKMMKS